MGGSARTEGVDAIVIGSQTRGWCRSGANLGPAPILKGQSSGKTEPGDMGSYSQKFRAACHTLFVVVVNGLDPLFRNMLHRCVDDVRYVRPYATMCTVLGEEV